jgi:hypothetical protein
MVKVTLVKEPKDFSLDIDIAIKQAIAEMEPVLEQTAQTSHRYNNRTGNLMRATKVDANKYSLKAYIDDKTASYGKFINNGFKSWQPDPFISNAIDYNKEKIKQTIINNINNKVR